MITINQLVKYKRVRKEFKCKTPALKGNPQQKGTCSKVYTTSPKKPNSAVRKIVNLLIKISGLEVKAYIPGEGNPLKAHSTVLMCGGRTPDLIGLKYRLIRGKFDFNGVLNRLTSRSLYGTKKKAVKKNRN
jgi:small subunit ribosomal protein S12